MTQTLENASYITSSSVSTYGEPDAVVVNDNNSGVNVRVNMPYSYEYSCDGGSSGAVDGLETTVVYQVTNSNVTTMIIKGDIRNACA